MFYSTGPLFSPVDFGMLGFTSKGSRYCGCLGKGSFTLTKFIWQNHQRQRQTLQLPLPPGVAQHPICVALSKVAKGSLKGFQALYIQASTVVDLLVTVRFFH